MKLRTNTLIALYETTEHLEDAIEALTGIRRYATKDVSPRIAQSATHYVRPNFPGASRLLVAIVRRCDLDQDIEAETWLYPAGSLYWELKAAGEL